MSSTSSWVSSTNGQLCLRTWSWEETGISLKAISWLDRDILTYKRKLGWLWACVIPQTEGASPERTPPVTAGKKGEVSIRVNRKAQGKLSVQPWRHTAHHTAQEEVGMGSPAAKTTPSTNGSPVRLHRMSQEKREEGVKTPKERCGCTVSATWPRHSMNVAEGFPVAMYTYPNTKSIQSLYTV